MKVWTEGEIRGLGVRTDLVTAGSVLGIGRTVSHELARRGEFPVPVLRLGRRYVVPTAPLLALLGLPSESNGPAPTTGAGTVSDHVQPTEEDVYVHRNRDDAA